MAGGFTCSRCLRAIQKASRRQHPVIGLFERRSLTTQARSPAIRRPQTDVNGRRWQTSLSSQTHDSEIAPPLVRPELQESIANITSLSNNALQDPDNLFHPFSTSPSPDMRRRGAFLRNHAYCPHPSHHRTRLPVSTADPETHKLSEVASKPPALVKFECPDCGIPVSCTETHWAEDYESHSELCETLRQINEDDHDLRSGRAFPEFEYPFPVMEEQIPNMTNWDTYLYTRDFNAVNEERPLRQVTKLLSYPITLASIIHELSPYNIRKGGRITVEGLKSLTGWCTSQLIS